MNRRDFLQRLGLAASAIVLSPMLDLAPIEPVRSWAGHSGALTLEMMERAAAKYSTGANYPTVIVCHPSVKAAYERLLKSEIRRF